MKISKTTLALIISFLTASTAYSADLGWADVSGEVSFDYNFLSSGDNTYPASGGVANEQYHFSQAQLLVKKETEELFFTARLIYMPMEFSTPAGDSSKNNFGTLNQVEVYYKVRKDLQLGFGIFVTTLGFESPMRTENTFYNYSVAYQGLVPGYNEGLRLKYNPGEYLAATISTYNRSAYNRFGDDYTPTKTTEVSLTGVAGRFTWFGGYYFGTDQTTTTPTAKIAITAADAWLTYKFSDDFSMSSTYDSKSQKPDGGEFQSTQSYTVQAAYTIENHTMGVRYEHLTGAGNLDALNGTTGVFYPGADVVDVYTVGDKIWLSDHLNLNVEYRYDRADQAVLKDSSGANANAGHMVTLGMAAHF
jgi:hypothetical protein